MEGFLFVTEQYVVNAGIWGPIVYMLAMIIAIVVSPIPSSPLAIFAGTVFGLWWGMLWTMIGAISGAIIAFYIARIFGRPLVLKFVSKESLSQVESRFSEQHITWAIFLSRLLPLPFFDVISYAAGLTRVSIKNFFIATSFGLIPLVFMFSYFGNIFADNIIAISILVIITTIIFFVFARIFYKRRRVSETGKR